MFTAARGYGVIMGRHHNHNHGHNHDSHGDSCPSQGADSRRLLIAAALTGAFMIAEVVGGLISGSLALLADAGHMTTDFGALIAAWIGVRMNNKRTSALIALLSGLSLLAVAAWVVKEGLERVADPAPVLAGTMMAVAVLGLLVNIVVFSILIKGNRKNLNIRGAILHVATDMLGSFAAILAAVIIMVTGFYPADPILSLLVSMLIVISAYPLIKDSLAALRAPANEE